MNRQTKVYRSSPLGTGQSQPAAWPALLSKANTQSAYATVG